MIGAKSRSGSSLTSNAKELLSHSTRRIKIATSPSKEPPPNRSGPPLLTTLGCDDFHEIVHLFNRYSNLPGSCTPGSRGEGKCLHFLAENRCWPISHSG